MVNGQSYKYRDISDVLVKNFNGINKNQISGLITKLSDNGFFERVKNVGSRMDYIYSSGVSGCSEDNEDEFKKNVNKKCAEFLMSLNNMKKDIEDADDFIWLQEKVDGLKELFDIG